MSEETLETRIRALPKEHTPSKYEVMHFDRKGNYLDKTYVRASSPKRAQLLGYKIAKYTLGVKGIYNSTVKQVCPPREVYTNG